MRSTISSGRSPSSTPFGARKRKRYFRKETKSGPTHQFHPRDGQYHVVLEPVQLGNPVRLSDLYVHLKPDLAAHGKAHGRMDVHVSLVVSFFVCGIGGREAVDGFPESGIAVGEMGERYERGCTVGARRGIEHALRRTIARVHVAVALVLGSSFGTVEHVRRQGVPVRGYLAAQDGRLALESHRQAAAHVPLVDGDGPSLPDRPRWEKGTVASGQRVAVVGRPVRQAIGAVKTFYQTQLIDILGTPVDGYYVPGSADLLRTEGLC